MDDATDGQMESEMAFLNAMRAFRTARDSGDAEAAATAEEAWRKLVLEELREGKAGAP